MKKFFFILTLVSITALAKETKQKNNLESSKKLTFVKMHCQWYTFITSDGEVFNVYANSQSEARDEVIRMLIDRENV